MNVSILIQRLSKPKWKPPRVGWVWLTFTSVVMFHWIEYTCIVGMSAPLHISPWPQNLLDAPNWFHSLGASPSALWRGVVVFGWSPTPREPCHASLWSFLQSSDPLSRIFIESSFKIVSTRILLSVKANWKFQCNELIENNKGKEIRMGDCNPRCSIF